MARRPRIRHHVNPLTLRHLDTGADRLAIPAGRPLEVELGCAEGEFLFGRCQVDAERTYVGVEIRREHVRAINARAEREGLPVIGVYANLLTDLEVLFEPGSIDLCHINFPDPFFKRSQHKRRFLRQELVLALQRVLRPGGVLAYQSDVYELAVEALEALELGSPPLQNLHGHWSFAPDHDFGARTRRERFCLEDGTKIWRVRFALTSARSPSP